MPEPIVMRSQPAVVVLEAPREALISLQVLAAADPRHLTVTGDLITIADQVVYRVVGWQPEPAALLCWLTEDRRTPREGP